MYTYRGHTIQAAFLLVGLIFLFRLFFIQVINEEYQLAAEKNIIQPVVEYPYRGAVYDRHGAYIVYNVPIYDLMVTPREVKDLDISAFCKDFGIDRATFEKLFQKAKSYSHLKSSIFIKNISKETWARVQDHLSDYLGFFIQVRTIRSYPQSILANTLGYVAEISAQQLRQDISQYYRQGDMIGISGLERTYEAVLRGQLGVQYKVSDAKGRAKGVFRGGGLR